MNSDMLAMQQEALKRVREMQEKQRASLKRAAETNHSSKKAPDDHPAALDKNNPPKSGGVQNKSKGNRFLKLFNFENFDFDSDSALILLIAILLSDSSDSELLLPALIYLLM